MTNAKNAASYDSGILHSLPGIGIQKIIKESLKYWKHKECIYSVLFHVCSSEKS